MDKKRLLLALGGTLISIGGIYWLYQKIKPPQYCSEYADQSSCEGAGCYWCIDHCQNTPCNGGEHGCQGSCFYLGQLDCDQYGNLCRCENGQRQLLQYSSPLCTGEYHYECFPSINGIMTCAPTAGPGMDLCPNPGYSERCSCIEHSCDIYHICEPRDYRCRLKAVNYPISATTENMDCFDSEGNSYCNYWLDEPVAALTLIGELFWKWGPVFPGEPVDFGIFINYNGIWTTIYEGTHWISSPEGSIPILASFASQGIEMIQFAVGALVSNVHVDRFIGHLNY